jgi:hypothetical protein
MHPGLWNTVNFAPSKKKLRLLNQLFKCHSRSQNLYTSWYQHCGCCAIYLVCVMHDLPQSQLCLRLCCYNLQVLYQ